MDMKFKKVAEILGNGKINIEEVREHLGEVDITIITVKESGRVITNTLP